MTANSVHLPHDLRGRVPNRIIDEVHGINRVVYDISGRPPGHIRGGVGRLTITEQAAARSERQGLRSLPR